MIKDINGFKIKIPDITDTECDCSSKLPQIYFIFSLFPDIRNKVRLYNRETENEIELLFVLSDNNFDVTILIEYFTLIFDCAEVRLIELSDYYDMLSNKDNVTIIKNYY